MNDAKMTIRLPAEDLEFAKAFAKDHNLSLTALIHRYLSNLRKYNEVQTIHPAIKEITGLIPSDVDVRDEYRTHIRDKH